MNDIRHSMKTGDWYSPPEVVEPSREVLGEIHLDPCGSERSNLIVKADMILTADGESTEWHPMADTGFVNPPGACEFVPSLLNPKKGTYKICGNKTRCSCGLPKKFLLRCYAEAIHGFSSVYLAYNISQVRQVSKLDRCERYGVITSMAVPPARLKFLRPDTLEPDTGANADSAILLISKDRAMHEHFRRVFTRLGCKVWQ